jgi:hypothetical protein
MMLLGLALENLAKGLIVAANPSALQIRGGAVRYPWGQKHLSVDLLRQAGYVPSADEAALVEILVEFVRWAGRFPAPLRQPDAEQRWDTELDTRYRALADTLRLRLKMSGRAQQRVSLEPDLRERLAPTEHDGVLLFESRQMPQSLYCESLAIAGRSSNSLLDTRRRFVSAASSTAAS